VPRPQTRTTSATSAETTISLTDVKRESTTATLQAVALAHAVAGQPWVNGATAALIGPLQLATGYSLAVRGELALDDVVGQGRRPPCGSPPAWYAAPQYCESSEHQKRSGCNSQLIERKQGPSFAKAQGDHRQGTSFTCHLTD
jgi:hypothetical protein